jgi:Domain of Unknown Function (DUF1080)
MGQRFGGLVGVTMLAALLAAAALGDDDSAFVRLFDGRTLEGWTGEHTDRYSVRDGAIVSNGGTGWLRYKKSFKDFELRAEYRAVEKEADSGLLFRASTQSIRKEPHWPDRGYQLQVMDARNSFAILGFGVAPPRFNRKSTALKEAMNGSGRWQTVTLRVIGTHAEAALNGQTITVSESIELREGSIGLRSESHPVEWRNLKIKELPTP